MAASSALIFLANIDVCELIRMINTEKSGVPLARSPTTGIAGCCARKVRGHGPPHRLAAAPQLTEVVLGYIGPCDVAAARIGLEWMRERYRGRGQTPPF
jgi:hypothetical protein